MTETRKWTIGTALVTVLVLVGAWFLLIGPKRAEVADLNAQTEQQLNENSAAETQLALLKEQNKDLPEKQAELAALRTKIPQTEDLSTYIREMQDLSKKSGVTFTSMTPADPVTIGAVAGAAPTGALAADQLAALNVTMVVGGNFFEITKFMNELETASRYTLVSGYTIGAEEQSTEEGAGGAASGDADLTATIDARIYLVPTSVDATAMTPTTAP